MYVGLKMIKNVPTVSPDDLVIDADKLMEEHRLWMLLVTKAGKLVGYVRKEDIRGALPSPATSLSRHEINYLLSELTVERLVRKDTPIIRPDAEIELAADLMDKKDLAGLAVVDAHDHLLGYINRSTMLGVLVEEMGLAQGGSRIAFEVEDRTGVLAEVSRIIFDMGISIISTATFYHRERRMVVIRAKTNDPGPIEVALTERGYAIVGPHTFEGEWLP